MLFLVHIITSHPSWKSAVEPLGTEGIPSHCIVQRSLLHEEVHRLVCNKLIFNEFLCSVSGTITKLNSLQIVSDSICLCLSLQSSAVHPPDTRALFRLMCRPWQHAKGRQAHSTLKNSKITKGVFTLEQAISSYVCRAHGRY